ncbi:ABC transporter substrate-binding protein [Pelagibius sp.]|uniref:ABC transporter substrate-binding protein n=1 Tax=Pelagibius sp. TaxID=1931238 RepID=UPI003BB1051F
MRDCVLGLTIGISLAFAGLNAASARDFTVTAWGGAVQDAKRDIFFTPFAKAEGVKVLDDVYAGGWAPFKAMQDTGVVPWDIVQVETAELVRGCEEGVFAPVDWTKVGNKGDFIPSAVSECGVGTTVWSIVVAYNADLVSEQPATVGDFWDLQRWPGKRGMRRGPKVNLELALMADGVSPADVYKELSTKEGLERAFAKLDEIKPEVQWWKSGAQAPEWLISGDVVMSLAYNGRVAKALEEGKDLKIIWENTLYDADAWAIPTGSPYIDLAHRFIRFASDPARQAKFTNSFAYGPTTVESMKMVDPARLPLLPAGANLDSGLHIGSEEAREFWADNLEELNERWNTWTSSE